MSRQFTILVRPNGEVLLSTYDGLEILSHEQLGINTKPDAMDKFLFQVRTNVWGAWQELVRGFVSTEEAR